MSEVTQLLESLKRGEARAGDELLPLVYRELRQLAAHRLSHEAPGQTLQATALVHEAYLRLVGDHGGPQWEGRAHFFGAAAEAMRRILVDRARRTRRVKHGGERQRVELHDDLASAGDREAELLAVNDLLDDLARQDAGAAEVVKLRYFAGYTLDEVADLLAISRSTVQRRWSFARAWLFTRFSTNAPTAAPNFEES
jgi:RNA polymerase sigma factor (TIGR02999 family)